MRNKKAFTLIELLVVIAVIAILATIVGIAITGAQKKARDNKRKSDLQAIGTAYLMHYQSTKSWTFSNTELQKLGAPASVVAEGKLGEQYFNYEDAASTNYFRISMSHALSGLGYTTQNFRDPLIPDDSTTYSSTATQYMKYLCKWADGTTHGIILYARLEDAGSVATPFSVDKNTNTDLCMYNASTTMNNYVKGGSLKMNYVIEVK